MNIRGHRVSANLHLVFSICSGRGASWVNLFMRFLWERMKYMWVHYGRVSTTNVSLLHTKFGHRLYAGRRCGKVATFDKYYEDMTNCYILNCHRVGLIEAYKDGDNIISKLNMCGRILHICRNFIS